MKNFVFDLYGTLIDIHTDEEEASFREWAKNTFFGLCGGECDFWNEYKRLCAPPEGDEYYEPDLLEVFARLAAECGGNLSKAALEEYAYSFRIASRKKLCLYPEVKSILCGLRQRGANVYLLSNAQACFTKRELDKVGLTDCFNGILLSSEASVKKPSVKFFDMIISKYKMDRAKTVYVGNDYFSDVCGSKAAGLSCVYIRTYNEAPLEMVRAKADWVCESHSELKNMLFSLAEEQ